MTIEFREGKLLPFNIRFTGPNMDISMQLEDLDDVELGLQVMEKIRKGLKNESNGPATKAADARSDVAAGTQGEVVPVLLDAGCSESIKD